MLNDLSRPTRLLLLGFGAALGVMVSGPVVGADSGVAGALLFVGLALELIVLVAFPVLLRRADRRLRHELARGTDEIAAGDVEPLPAIGRLVRARPDSSLGWHLPGAGSGPAPSSIVVLTALGSGPPRRVAALVPDALGLTGTDTPAVLLLHPRRRDVAVVDDRVTPERLADVATDPRWTTERLPTDRAVVGGYLALLLALAVGVAVGVVVGAGLGAGAAALVTLAT